MVLGRARIVVALLAALSAPAAIGAACGSSPAPAPRPTVLPGGLLAVPRSSGTTAKPGGTSTTASTTTRPASLGSLRDQWLDAEAVIRSAGATAAQQLQIAIQTQNTALITSALDQEVDTVGAQDRVIADLAWPISMRPDVDAFERSSAAALDQLRGAAANPSSYDAGKINASIADFDAAANVVRHDLGLPPD